MREAAMPGHWKIWIVAWTLVSSTGDSEAFFDRQRAEPRAGPVVVFDIDPTFGLPAPICPGPCCCEPAYSYPSYAFSGVWWPGAALAHPYARQAYPSGRVPRYFPRGGQRR
jgi:hypothetical protein